MASTLPLVSTLVMTPRARANPEPPALYDARIVGMGGTGIAHVLGPAAAVHNPAQLDTVEDFDVNLTATNLFVRFRASFSGAGNEQDSPLIYAPLPFLGGAIRFTDRFTLGMAAYISTGFGGGFSNVERIGVGEPCIDGLFDIRSEADHCFPEDDPQDQNVTLVIGELAIPMSIRILDNFRVGLALRLPYGAQRVSTHQEITGALLNAPFYGLGYARVNQSVSGFGTPGVLLGATYDATPTFSLAVAYRSKIRISMSGTTDIALRDSPLLDNAIVRPIVDGLPAIGMLVDGLVTDIPTKTDWYVPHMFRVGFAKWLLDRRLLVSAELKVQFHKEANKEQVFRMEGAAANIGLAEMRADFDWRNVYLGLFGAEFWATANVPLRVGFTIGNSATPKHTTNAFAPPPGLQVGGYFGSGIRFGKFAVDLGFGYGSGPQYEREALPAGQYYPTCQPGQPVKAGCSGVQAVRSYFLSLGATYRR